MKNNFKKYAGIIISSSLFAYAIFFGFAFKANALSDVTMSLGIGSTGADVTTLQTFLAEDPSIYPQGLVTGYYGQLTADAVTNFQTRYGIEPVGKVGPITMAEINNLINNGGFGSATGVAVSGQSPYISGVSTVLSSQFSPGTANSTVIVSWQTDRDTTGKVYYSTSPIVVAESESPTIPPTVIGANVVSDDTLTTSKSISLNDLWPTGVSGPYYYMIESTDANGNVSVTWPREFDSTGVSSSY